MLLGYKEERVSYVAIAFCELNKGLTHDQLAYISTWLWKISAPVESTADSRRSRSRKRAETETEGAVA